MYGFNLGQIDGLNPYIKTVTLTIANATESNTYTLVNTSGNTWVSNPEVEPVESEIILSTLNGDGVTFIITLKSFTESDVGDAYNVTLSTSAVEENFKSAVETVLVDNGLIGESETIFDETLTLTDEELYYELPSDFPDGWYENAVCTVNGVEIPKDPETEYGFRLLTNTISVTVSYIPSDGGYSAALSFSYCDVPNDYAIIPGDYQVKIVTQAEGGGDSSGLPAVTEADEGKQLTVVNGEWSKNGYIHEAIERRDTSVSPNIIYTVQFHRQGKLVRVNSVNIPISVFTDIVIPQGYRPDDNYDGTQQLILNVGDNSVGWVQFNTSTNKFTYSGSSTGNFLIDFTYFTYNAFPTE